MRSGQWARIGAGVAFALAAAAIFGLALVLTQHETATLDGRVRTATTMVLVGFIALALWWACRAAPTGHGPRWAGAVWLTLTFLYGTAFTIMFTVLPKLGVAGNSAIMNVEPIFALVLAWAMLGQRIAPIQMGGALIVVGRGHLAGVAAAGGLARPILSRPGAQAEDSPRHAEDSARPHPPRARLVQRARA